MARRVGWLKVNRAAWRELRRGYRVPGVTNMYAMAARWEDVGYVEEVSGDPHLRVWRHRGGDRWEVRHFPGCCAKRTRVSFIAVEAREA